MERCQEMTCGVICGLYGGKTYHEDDGAIYNRVTRISDCEKQVLSDCERHGLRGMSSRRSWVAVQGDKSIFFAIPRSSCLHIAPEEPDFSKMFPSGEPMAAVSMSVGTDEVNNGSGIEVSRAKFNEKAAINFLRKVFAKAVNEDLTLTFTDADAEEAARSAFGYLFRDKSKVNEIEIFVLEKGDSKESGSSNAMSPDGSNSGSFDSMCPDETASMSSVPVPRLDVGCESMETCNEKSKIRCNRETHICCGGWDSQLLKSLGFSWITVQGKDYICVVTQDEVALGKGYFENVLSHLKGNQMFRFKSLVDQSAKESFMISPFAAVSVRFHEESGHHGASSAEIKAIEFLMKKIKKYSDLTYEATVQTAISALLILAQKDLKPEEIKVFVLRNGEDLSFPSKLLATEIEEHLCVIKRPRFLLTTKIEEHLWVTKRPRFLLTTKIEEHLPVIKRPRL